MSSPIYRRSHGEQQLARREAAKRRPRSPAAGRPLRLEPLEDRHLLSTVAWSGPGLADAALLETDAQRLLSFSFPPSEPRPNEFPAADAIAWPSSAFAAGPLASDAALARAQAAALAALGRFP